MACFGISTWRAHLRRDNRADRLLLERAAKVYQSIRPHADLEAQPSSHVAAGLVQIACGLVEPHEAYLEAALAKAALREFYR